MCVSLGAAQEAERRVTEKFKAVEEKAQALLPEGQAPPASIWGTVKARMPLVREPVWGSYHARRG